MKLAQMPFLVLLIGLPAGCGGREGTERDASGPTVTSSAFEDGERIPERYTADGADVSPPLAFDQLPAGTKELALICEDPDAPGATPWVHWVVYGIDPSAGGLEEDFEPGESGAREGRNSWPEGDNLGWRGPAPPPGSGDHRYIFTLYALDTTIDLARGAAREQLKDAMASHTLGSGTLTGLYSR